MLLRPQSQSTYSDRLTYRLSQSRLAVLIRGKISEPQQLLELSLLNKATIPNAI